MLPHSPKPDRSKYIGDYNETGPHMRDGPPCRRVSLHIRNTWLPSRAALKWHRARAPHHLPTTKTTTLSTIRGYALRAVSYNGSSNVALDYTRKHVRDEIITAKGGDSRASAGRRVLLYRLGTTADVHTRTTLRRNGGCRKGAPEMIPAMQEARDG